MYKRFGGYIHIYIQKKYQPSVECILFYVITYLYALWMKAATAAAAAQTYSM